MHPTEQSLDLLRITANIMGGEVLEPVFNFQTTQSPLYYAIYPLAVAMVIVYIMLFFSEPGKATEIDPKKLTDEDRLQITISGDKLFTNYKMGRKVMVKNPLCYCQVAQVDIGQQNYALYLLFVVLQLVYFGIPSQCWFSQASKFQKYLKK